MSVKEEIRTQIVGALAEPSFQLKHPKNFLHHFLTVPKPLVNQEMWN